MRKMMGRRRRNGDFSVARNRAWIAYSDERHDLAFAWWCLDDSWSDEAAMDWHIDYLHVCV